jgi:sugar (pentulose or hexulose) kinase
VPESASLGSAVLAAVGCGLHRDVASAVGAMVRTHVVEPDAARGGTLEGRYHHWREIYATFKSWTLT